MTVRESVRERRFKVPLLRLALALGVFLAGHSQVAAQNYCTAATPGDGSDDSSALQTCLNGGGTILLSTSGTYDVGSPLTINQDWTILSTTGAGRATLKATTTLNGRILNADVSSYQLLNLKFIGRKAYGHTRANLTNPNDCGNLGQNANIGGSTYIVSNVESMDATCGSGLVVRGSGYTVRDSYFHDNGYETGGSWADGLTVGSCFDCWIYNNDMDNNTDIGLVTGGGYGDAEYNTITNTSKYAFAGIHVGWFPGGDGDHTGMSYTNNTVTSDQNMMSFGLIAGFEPWYNGQQSEEKGYVTHAGTVQFNTITGAVVNLAVDGIGSGTITSNPLSSHQGTKGYQCTLGARSSTYHMSGSATIQGSPDAVWFFRGSCGTWNPALPHNDGPGVLRREWGLAPGEELWSDNGAYFLVQQATDGNLVLYNSSGVDQWATNVFDNSPKGAYMQLDGNFILETHNSQQPYWDTQTCCNEGAYLVVQDDGNVVVYSLSGSVLWSIF